MNAPLIKRYSRPIWAGKGKSRHQKGTVLATQIDQSLFVAWSLCDPVDLRSADGITISYNTEHGRSLAQGRFDEIMKGKHYTFATKNPPSYAELLVAGVPQSAVPVIVDLVINILQNQVAGNLQINAVSIYVKKPLRDVRGAFKVISSVASKVNLNLQQVAEPIY